MSICKFRKSSSSILLSLTINTCILEVFFCIFLSQKRNTNAFQKQVQSILETHKSRLFFIHFQVTNFGSQIISKSILEVYFIFRVQKYIQSISTISAGQNTNISLYKLWSNGLVVRVQVYQTKDSRFKNHTVAEKLPQPFILLQSNDYQGFQGTCWLKVSSHCDSAA